MQDEEVGTDANSCNTFDYREDGATVAGRNSYRVRASSIGPMAGDGAIVAKDAADELVGNGSGEVLAGDISRITNYVGGGDDGGGAGSDGGVEVALYQDISEIILLLHVIGFYLYRVRLVSKIPRGRCCPSCDRRCR